MGWIFPNLPICLVSQKKLLLSSLSGLAPIHSSYKDNWGWGNTGFYSTAKGFFELQAVHSSSLSMAIWKSVWSPHYLPKVKKFTWLILDNKVLTGDNMLKHGFNAPFWCCFCKLNFESTDHILIDCEFSKSCGIWCFTVPDSLFLFKLLSNFFTSPRMNDVLKKW